MNFAAVIPARGGSKSIKNKNIFKVKNKPLIFYSINQAIKSKIFKKIFISSDSIKILNICKKFKNLELVERPKKISSDKSKTVDAILHVIKKYNIFFKKIDVVFVLEPTSPLRSCETILRSAKVFHLNKLVDSLISVVPTKSLYGKINKKNLFTYFEKRIKRRRQERNPIYKETGTIWATKTKYLIKHKKIVGGNIFPLVISKQEDLDINDMGDIKIFKNSLR